MATIDKPALWRRWLGICLRSAHVAGVVLLGATLHGAPLDPRIGAVSTVISGAGLLAVEWADTRIRLTELAGTFALLKLAAVAWMAVDPASSVVLFWLLLVVSGLVSHAPRGLRHWRPGR
jgi:hypothetical protein